jgi:hypothetical protein
MDQQQGMSSKITPFFKGHDYVFSRIRMKSHLMALRFDILKSVEDGYTTPSSPQTDVAANNLCNDNSRDVNAILSGFFQKCICKSNELQINQRIMGQI